MDNKQYLGLDVGKVRTGFARGSSVAKIAQPLFTVETAKVATKLKEIMANESVEAVVIGLPRNLNGDDTEQTKWVRQWVDELKKIVDITIYQQDEALTSKLAEMKKESDTKNDIDSLAAGVILQDFLNSDEAERVVW